MIDALEETWQAPGIVIDPGQEGIFTSIENVDSFIVFRRELSRIQIPKTDRMSIRPDCRSARVGT